MRLTFQLSDMSDNSFGKLFSFTSFGESHGPGIGCVVDGAPPRMALSENMIQSYLDRRKPGQNRFVTQRQEEDKVEILSGVFEGKTIGTPIGLLIRKKDSVPGIMVISPSNFGPAMQITPIRKNMASATIAVVAGHQRARRRYVLPLVPLPTCFSSRRLAQITECAAALCKLDRTKSTGII